MTHLPQRHECACVVPFFNERDRILHVLDVVTTIPHLAQVICVDDGSTDGTTALVARRFPQVSVLLLPRNSGKAAAVQAAADLVRTSHMLLMDADLRGLAAVEIDRAIAAALANPEIDMIILRRIKAGMHARLCRGDVLFSGERIVKTADLLAALAANPSRYQIEIALNRYMLENGKRVCWMPSSARNTLKVQKQGPVRGLAGDVAMVKNMVDYAGVGAYLEQYLFFAREAGEQPRDFQSLAESTKRPQALGTLPQPLRRLRRFSR
jgi:glycosyltransferase involved in cell wall biosynthesis